MAQSSLGYVDPDDERADELPLAAEDRASTNLKSPAFQLAAAPQEPAAPRFATPMASALAGFVPQESAPQQEKPAEDATAPAPVAAPRLKGADADTEQAIQHFGGPPEPILPPRPGYEDAWLDATDRRQRENDAQQAGIHAFLKSRGVETETLPDGSQTIATHPDGAPVWKPATSAPFQDPESGQWVVRQRDDHGHLRDVSALDVQGAVHTDAKTGDQYVYDQNRQPVKIGTDWGIAAAHAIATTRSFLYARENQAAAQIADLNASLTPVRDQYHALQAQAATESDGLGGKSKSVKQLENTKASLQSAINGGTASDAVKEQYQAASDALTKFGQDHPEYEQVKATLDGGKTQIRSIDADRRRDHDTRIQMALGTTSAAVQSTLPDTRATTGQQSAPDDADPAEVARNVAVAAGNGTPAARALVGALRQMKASGAQTVGGRPIDEAISAAVNPPVKPAPEPAPQAPATSAKGFWKNMVGTFMNAADQSGALLGEGVLRAFGATDAADEAGKDARYAKEVASGQFSPDNPYRPGGPKEGQDLKGWVDPARKDELMTGIAGAASDVPMFVAGPWAAVPSFTIKGASEAGDEAASQGKSRSMGALKGAGQGVATLAAYAVGGPVAKGLTPAIEGAVARGLATAGISTGVNSIISATMSSVFGGNALPQTPAEWGQRLFMDAGFGLHASIESAKLPGHIASALNAKLTLPEQIQLSQARLQILEAATATIEAGDAGGAHVAATAENAAANLKYLNDQKAQVEKFLKAQNPKLVAAIDAKVKAAADAAKTAVDSAPVDPAEAATTDARQFTDNLRKSDILQRKAEALPADHPLEERTQVNDRQQATQDALDSAHDAAVEAVPEVARKAIAATLGAKPEAIKAHFDEQPGSAFQAAHVGRQLRDLYTTPEQRARLDSIAARVGEHGPTARFIADQHVGMKAARDLTAIAALREVPPERVTGLQRLGLVEMENGQPVVTHDALPLLPKGMTARLIGSHDAYRVKSLLGEKLHGAAAMVRAGQGQLEQALHAKALAVRPPAEMATHRVRVQFTNKAGKSGETTFDVKARNEEEATASAMARVEKSGAKVNHAEVTTAAKEQARKFAQASAASANDPLGRNKIAYVDATDAEQKAYSPEQRQALARVESEFARNKGLFKQFGIDRVTAARAEGDASGIATSTGRLSVDPAKLLEQLAIVKQRAGHDVNAGKKWVRNALMEEVVHQATIKGLGPDWMPKLKAAWNDPAMTKEMRDAAAAHAAETYDGFENLDDHQKAAEFVRMVVQGRWKRGITEQVVNIIRDLHAYLTGLKVEHSPLLQEAIDRTRAALIEARKQERVERREERERANAEPQPPAEPSASSPPVSPKSSGPHPNTPEEQSRPSPEPATPAAEAQAEPEKPARKPNFKFTVNDGGFSQDPIVARIMEHGGLLSKSSLKQQWGAAKYAANAGESEDAATMRHPSHNAIYSRDGMTPDEAVAVLHGDGQGQPAIVRDGFSTADLWAHLDRASRTAKDIMTKEAGMKKDAAAQRQMDRAFTKDTATKGRGEKEVTAWDVNPGDTVQVGTEEKKVVSVDAANGSFVLEDGHKYGTQEVEGHMFGKLERAEDGELGAARAKKDSVAEYLDLHQSLPDGAWQMASEGYALRGRNEQKAERIRQLEKEFPGGALALSSAAMDLQSERVQARRAEIKIMRENGQPVAVDTALHAARAKRKDDGGQRDMFAGPDAPFNLAGEKGEDGFRVSREKEQAQRDAEEAKAKERDQMTLFASKAKKPMEWENEPLPKKASAEDIAHWNAANEIKRNLYAKGFLTSDVMDTLNGKEPSGYRVPDMESIMKQSGDRRDYADVVQGQRDRLEDKPTHREAFTSKPTDTAFDWALQHHGEAGDIGQAGYVLPDGRLLDFSEYRNGGGGDRSLDHRSIQYVGRPSEGYAAMRDFMEKGAVRIDANSGAIDIAKKPTSAQERQIRRVLEGANGGAIDVTDGKRRAAIEVSEDSIDKAIGRIRRFYAGEDIESGQLFAARAKPRDDERGGPVEVGHALLDADTPILTDLADVKGHPHAESAVLVDRSGVHHYDLTGEKPVLVATSKATGDKEAIAALTDASIPKVRNLDEIDRADFPEATRALVVRPNTGRLELVNIASEEPIASGRLMPTDEASLGAAHAKTAAQKEATPEGESKRKAIIDTYEKASAEAGKTNEAKVDHEPADEESELPAFWRVYSSAKGNDHEASIYQMEDGRYSVRDEHDDGIGASIEPTLEGAIQQGKWHVEASENQDEYDAQHEARQELIHSLKVPSGWEIDDVQDTKWGSIYYKLKRQIGESEDGEPEYDTYKLSIRDHEPSPFREREFGKSDWWTEVPKDATPQDIAEAVSRTEAWVAREDARGGESLGAAKAKSAKEKEAERLAKLRETRAGFAAETDAAPAPAPEPHILTKPEGRSAINAYHHLVRTTGFPAVSIADLADQSGVPLDRLKQQLLRSQKAGSVVLSTGDWSLASDKQRAGAIEQPGAAHGDRPMLQVRFLSESGDLAAARAQTKTPEFKKWFGDSKVVEPDGAPRVVYHGSTEEFATFKHGDLGFHFGFPEAAAERQNTGNKSGDYRIKSFFLSLENPINAMHDAGEWQRLGDAVDAMPDNVISKAGKEAIKAGDSRSINSVDDLRAYLQRRGFDGVVYPNAFEGGTSYIAFDPKQIKSATDNRGTFDPADANTLFAAKAVAAAHAKVAQAIAPLRDEVKTSGTKREIAQDFDATGTHANIQGLQAQTHIRLPFERTIPKGETRAQAKAREAAVKQDLVAARPVVEAGGSRARLAAELAKVNASTDAKLKAKFAPIYQYALANFDRLNRMLAPHVKLANENYDTLKAAGVDVGKRAEYVHRVTTPPEDPDAPHLAFEMGNGNGQGNARGMLKGRSFDTMGDAIRAGYDPGDYGIHEADGRMVQNSTRIIGDKQFLDKMKQVKAPTDGKTIIGQLVKRRLANGETDLKVPDGYTSVNAMGRPLVIHKMFAPLFRDLYGTSAIRNFAAGRALLKLAAAGKHGTLVFDTFHVGRLLYKMAAGGGGLPIVIRDGKPVFNYHAGLSMLEYSDADLATAVKQGEVTPEEAAYAKKHRAALDELVKAGLNVGKVADNLMDQVKSRVPGLTAMNDWIFGKLSRGAMVQTALAFHERNLARPGLTREQAARRTATEMNEYFGNLQNQGMFKSKTLQDIARLVFLAPNWTESQARYEARAYGQLGASAVDAARGKGLRAGNATRAMATGFVALLAANQVANYLSRGQSTFENEEDGHKLDAWVPGGKRGFWFNPFEIAGEYAHAALKYTAQHENPVDVATHILSNKLSPLGRGVKEAGTGRDAMGRHFLSDADRFRSAAVDTLPAPLPASAFFEKDPRAPIGYRVTRANGGILPSMEKQLLQSGGAKVTAAQSPRTAMFAIAHDYRPDGQYSDNAGEFSNLRAALDNDDTGSAKTELRWLLDRGKEPKAIAAALGIHANGISPERFTGSVAGEKEMLKSFTPAQTKLYSLAQSEHRANAQKFLEIVRSEDGRKIISEAKQKAAAKAGTH